MKQWMIFFNIVFFQTIGTKYIEQTDLLHNLDIGIQLVYAEAIFTFLEELIPINKDLMIFTSLILSRESFWRLKQLETLLNQEHSTELLFLKILCILLEVLMDKDWMICIKSLFFGITMMKNKIYQEEGHHQDQYHRHQEPFSHLYLISIWSSLQLNHLINLKLMEKESLQKQSNFLNLSSYKCKRKWKDYNSR